MCIVAYELYTSCLHTSLEDTTPCARAIALLPRHINPFTHPIYCPVGSTDHPTKRHYLCPDCILELGTLRSQIITLNRYYERVLRGLMEEWRRGMDILRDDPGRLDVVPTVEGLAEEMRRVRREKGERIVRIEGRVREMERGRGE
jgi:hypothetical protein